jgi:ubiquitin C-terminal hydrolase
MDAYDPAYAPAAYGLNNTGAICYLNSFLQALAGCTALCRAILQNADYLARTRTGAAMLAYFRALADEQGARPQPAPGTASLSAAVLGALVADLAARRPHVSFGAGQESASEALVHLLDMMEPEPAGPQASGAAGTAGTAPALSEESPVTRLFLHRFRCELHCRRCARVVSMDTDNAVTFNLFHFDHLREPPATPETFSRSVRLQVSVTEDYRCPGCAPPPGAPASAPASAPAGAPASAYRTYMLTMIPEVIVCAFNLYVGYGGVRRARYFPERLEFPALNGGTLVFLLVGQVEHAGSLAGGHYWARARRAGGAVYLLNDSSVAPDAFTPSPNTYLLFYHYAGLVAAGGKN